MAGSIAHVIENELIADDPGAFEDILPLGHEFVPFGCVRFQIDRDETVARGVLVGNEPQIVPGPFDEFPVVGKPGNQRPRLPPVALTMGEIHHMHFIARIGADMTGDYRKPAILCHLRTMAMVRVIGRGVDQFVLILRSAEAMEIDRLIIVERLECGAFFRCGKARIEKALLAHPGQCRELGPADLVVEHFTRLHIEDPQDTPVGATVLHAVEQVMPIVRGLPRVERGSAILGPCVRIDQQLRITAQPLAYEKLRLRLQPGVARVEVTLARLHRQTETLEVHEGADPFGKMPALRQPGQIAFRDGVLAHDPVGYLGRVAHVGFEPAIGIGDLFTEVVFDDAVAAGFGISDFRHGFSGNGGRDGQPQAPDQRPQAEHASLPTQKRPGA